ncbi:MAG: primosomal protein N', partial [Pacificimonas sp.]
MSRLRVLTLNAALPVLDYAPREGCPTAPGTIVRVPLGPREINAVVWEAARLPVEEVEAARLRKINGAHDTPPIPERLRRLIEWTADYYCAPMSAVARMVLSSGGAMRGPATMTEYRLTGGMPERMTPQRERAMERLDGEQATIRELAEIAGVSDG